MRLNASPPRRLPGPPESVTKLYSVTCSGSSASINSTGLFERFAAGLEMPSMPSSVGARAPGADHHFGENERLAVLPPADREQRRAALAAGDDVLRHDLRQRTHDGVEHAVAHHAARRARRRMLGIEDRSARHDQLHRPHVAFAVRDLAVGQAADRAIGGRVHHRDRAVHRRLHLRRRAGEIDRDAVALDRRPQRRCAAAPDRSPTPSIQSSNA